MAPKRKDKENGVVKSQKEATLLDQPRVIGATEGGFEPLDSAFFAQVLQKPIAIYKDLRNRHRETPLFLHRNLTYMKHRMSRSHANRKNFSADSLKDNRVVKRITASDGHLQLQLLGFYDPSIGSIKTCDIGTEVKLIQYTHRKRKEGTSASVIKSLGNFKVQLNPTLEEDKLSNLKQFTLQIPHELFLMSNGEFFYTYELTFAIVYDEPRAFDIVNDENNLNEQPTKKRKSAARRTYTASIYIYKRNSQSASIVCSLTDGLYCLQLKETTPSRKPQLPRNAFWYEDDGSFKNFLMMELESKPQIKFYVRWNSIAVKSLSPTIRRPTTRTTTSSDLKTNGTIITNKGKLVKVTYCLTIKESSARSTVAPINALVCLWCSLNCHTLYSLLKHLRLCHPRMKFTLQPSPDLSYDKNVTINVDINSAYDGAYEGSPYDITGARGLQNNYPRRRQVITTLLVVRPRRIHNYKLLTEFLQKDDCETDLGLRPYINGHARSYYHTRTCLTISEQDYDSEDENDPVWLQLKTKMMIDDFTDVNEGEKEFMKLWNLHMMKYGYVGDCQLPLALRHFVTECGKEIMLRKLYRNFLLHMACLFDFGLVGGAVIYEVIRQLQGLRELPVGAELERINHNKQEQQIAASASTSRVKSGLTPAPKKRVTGSGTAMSKNSSNAPGASSFPAPPSVSTDTIKTSRTSLSNLFNAPSTSTA